MFERFRTFSVAISNNFRTISKRFQAIFNRFRAMLRRFSNDFCGDFERSSNELERFSKDCWAIFNAIFEWFLWRRLNDFGAISSGFERWSNDVRTILKRFSNDFCCDFERFLGRFDRFWTIFQQFSGQSWSDFEAIFARFRAITPIGTPTGTPTDHRPGHRPGHLLKIAWNRSDIVRKSLEFATKHVRNRSKIVRNR